jgi:hypothetical protein
MRLDKIEGIRRSGRFLRPIMSLVPFENKKNKNSTRCVHNLGRYPRRRHRRNKYLRQLVHCEQEHSC